MMAYRCESWALSSKILYKSNAAMFRTMMRVVEIVDEVQVLMEYARMVPKRKNETSG